MFVLVIQHYSHWDTQDVDFQLKLFLYTRKLIYVILSFKWHSVVVIYTVVYINTLLIMLYCFRNPEMTK